VQWTAIFSLRLMPNDLTVYLAFEKTGVWPVKDSKTLAARVNLSPLSPTQMFKHSLRILTSLIQFLDLVSATILACISAKRNWQLIFIILTRVFRRIFEVIVEKEFVMKCLAIVFKIPLTYFWFKFGLTWPFLLIENLERKKLTFTADLLTFQKEEGVQKQKWSLSKQKYKMLEINKFYLTKILIPNLGPNIMS
jgi:hypothetical protein